MSDATTKRMIKAYLQMAQPTLFLSGLFQSPPQNIHMSQEVEIDIVRSEEDVSIALEDVSTGYRFNSDNKFTSKGFKPPVHKEAVPINSFDLLKRAAGREPFQSPDFRADIIALMFSGMQKVERKIRRSVELQASQVLQTGIVTLTDASGTPLYTLDFKPTASHFPTAGVSWQTASGQQKIDDINALSEQIRNDGLEIPDQLIMGVDAFENFISDAVIQTRFDSRRIELGSIAPMTMKGNGGIFRGLAEIGNYRYDVWTYGGRYKDPQTASNIQFISPGKIIVRASSGRMDATFGAIPNIGQIMGSDSASLIPELPSRISNSEGGMDMFTNAWLNADKSQLFLGVGARPLMIPTAIDTFGCLDTRL